MRLPILIIGIVLLIFGGLLVVAGLAVGAQLCNNSSDYVPLPNIPSCNALALTVLALWGIGGLLFMLGLVITIVGAVLQEPKPPQALYSNYPVCKACRHVCDFGAAFCPVCGTKLG